MDFTVSDKQDGLMLSALLVQMSGGLPVRAVRETMNARDVKIDGRKIAGDERVRSGQKIRVFWPKAYMRQKEAELEKPEIVFEDEHVLIIAKPQGIESQNEQDPLAGGTALTRCVRMLNKRGEDGSRLALCHRLDVQTGGLLMLTKDETSYRCAYEAFSLRSWQKFYTCLVKGCPAQEEMVLRGFLRKDSGMSRVSVTDYPARGAVPITTGYRILKKGTDMSLLEVELITGRTHQIRAHLAHIGHPVAGDDRYGDREFNRRMKLRRQQLWATKLVIHARQDEALGYLDGKIFETECPFSKVLD